MLLPGIRHTRTPLAAGATWFLIFWLALGPEVLIPTADGSEFQQRLHALVNLASPGVIAAILAFLATLLGSLIPPISPRFVRFFEHVIYVPAISWFVSLPVLKSLIGPLLPPGFWHPRPEDTIEETIARQSVGPIKPTWDALDSVPDKPYALGRALAHERRMLEEQRETTEFQGEPDGRGQPRASRRYETFYQVGSDHIDNQVLQVTVEEVLKSEYEQLSILLQIDRPEMFDELDRLNSEVELRRALFAPLCLLVILVAVLSTPFVLVLVILPVTLLLQSIDTERKARMRVYTALRHGVIQSPTLTWISTLQDKIAEGDIDDGTSSVDGPKVQEVRELPLPPTEPEDQSTDENDAGFAAWDGEGPELPKKSRGRSVLGSIAALSFAIVVLFDYLPQAKPLDNPMWVGDRLFAGFVFLASAAGWVRLWIRDSARWHWEG